MNTRTRKGLLIGFTMGCLVPLLAWSDGYYNRVVFVRAPKCANSIARVQSTPLGIGDYIAHNSSTQSRTITEGAGHLLVAIGVSSNAAEVAMSVTDTLGNTWRETPAQGNANFYSQVQIFYAENVAGGTNTITLTQSPGGSSVLTGLTVIEYSGIANSQSVIAAAGQIAPTNTATVSTGAMSMDTDCSALVVAAFVDNNVSFSAPGVGWARVAQDSYAYSFVEDNAASLATAGSSINASATLIGADSAWAGTQVAFRMAGSAVPAAITQLAITSSAQTLSTSWLCSGMVTVQTRNAAGAAQAATSSLRINLSGTGGMTFFSDVACKNPVTSVEVLSGRSSQSFYFMGGSTGNPTLTTAASGLTDASQVETISGLIAYTWTGGGSCDGNWSTAACWSSGAVPGSANIAHFDGNCVTNCTATPSGAVTLGGVWMHPGFVGTVAMGSRTINLTASDLIVAGGTLTLTSGTINAQLGIRFSGGTAALGGTVKVRQDYVVTGGTLDFSGSTLIFNDSVTSCWNAWRIRPGAVTYNNVNFVDSASCGVIREFASGSTMNVAGTLTIGSVSGRAVLSRGTISALGGVVVQSLGAFGNGDPTQLKIAGSTNQTLDFSSATTPFVPSLYLASIGGTVTIVGSPIVQTNFVYQSGVVDFLTNGTTLQLNDPYNCSPGGNTWTVDLGPLTYNNIAFLDATACNPITRVLGNGQLAQLAGALTLGSQNATSFLNGGLLSVAGNVTVQNLGYGFNGQLAVAGNWVNTSSSPFAATGGQVLFSSGAGHTITGNNIFYDLTMDNSAVSTANSLMFQASRTQTINGHLYLRGNTTNRLLLLSSAAGIAASLNVSAGQTMGGSLEVRDVIPSNDIHTGASSSLISNFGTTTRWVSP